MKPNRSRLRETSQPIPTPDPATGFAECNWSNPYTLTVNNPSDPTDWVSGIYLAVLTGSSGKQAYVVFVVRDDSRPSDLLFQSSTDTYQAYNNWGGKSLYSYNSTTTPVGESAFNNEGGGVPALIVSYNRPYADEFGSGQFMSYEFDMLSFLESQGYDVTYTTNVDVHSGASVLNLHKGFLSVGHDEYWSYEMRQAVTQAINQGLNVGFFSADSCYWQIRFAPSAITGAPNRTIIGYKENAPQLDPDGQNQSTYYLETTQWRLPHATWAANPEDALLGVMYIPFEPVDSDVVVVNPSHWVFANTGLNSGDHLAGLLGYEVDAIAGDAPANLVDLAHSPYVFSDGSTQVADMTIYQATSGAYVFATGTVQWSWGLSNISPWGPSVSRVSAAAQKTTENVLDTFINNPPAAPATISLRSMSSASTSGTGGDHITVNIPTGVTPGDVMIAQVAVRGGSGTTLTPPAGWSLVRRDDNGGNLAQAVYSHVVPTSPGEPASYTWTFNAGNDGTAGIADFVGVSTVSPVEVNDGQSNASSTSITAPSITIASGHNADLLLEMFATAAGSAVSVPPGSTYVWGFRADSFGAGMGMAYLNPVPSGATGNWVASSSSAGANIGALIALAPGSPVPTATVSATPAGTSSAGATPTSSATPTTVPTPAPTPTPTPTQVATPTPTPTSGGTTATIVLRGVTTGSTASGSLGSVTINVPASIQANDVMLAEIAVRGGSGTTLTPPAQWAQVRRDDNSSTISQALYVHVVTAPASEPASYTWTFTSGTDGVGGMVAYGGVSSATPVDVAGGQANASSTSITAAAVTVPSGNNADRLVGLFAIPNSSAVTGPSGMTQRWSLHASSGGIGVEMSDLALSSSGATGSKSATAATAGANIGALVALLPASTGATPTASATPSDTPTPTASATPSDTPTPTASATPSDTPTPTASATLTPTASPTPAGTPAPTATTTAATPTSTPTSAGPTPTPAPITLRGVTTGSTASGSLGSVTINVPASIQANDVMLAEIAVRGGSGTTLTPPAQWAQVRRDNNSSTISQALYRARGHGAGFRTGELYLDLHQRHGWRGRDGGLWWGQ